MPRPWLKSFGSFLANRAIWESGKRIWSELPEPVRQIIVGPLSSLFIGSAAALYFREHWYLYPIAGLLIGFGVAGARIAVRDWRRERDLSQRSELLKHRAEGRRLLEAMKGGGTPESISRLVNAWRSHLFESVLDGAPSLALKIQQYTGPRREEHLTSLSALMDGGLGMAKLRTDLELTLQALDELLN